MEGLFSFLFFAAFIYLMVRFGCGAHMLHGHGSGHDKDKHVDPVCGKSVPENEGYGMMHSGRFYRFCSKVCLDAFDSEPERYTGARKELTQ